MTALAKTNGESPLDVKTIEEVLLDGDLARMAPAQRVAFYRNVCDSLGLNALTKPFQYMKNRAGKLVLYATKDCTDQLRALRDISLEIVSKDIIGAAFVVHVKATMPGGRKDEDIGALILPKSESSDDYTNTMMKCVTKAKRRVTLSICGLGFVPDEMEVSTIPGAAAVKVNPETGEIEGEEFYGEMERARATEQANDKRLSDNLVEEFKKDLEQIADTESFLAWCYHNGSTFSTLHTNAHGRLWTAIKNTAKRLEVDTAEVREAIRSSAADAKESMGEPMTPEQGELGV